MVRSPVFVRWSVITLGWMLAEPEALTLRVFPVMLQLVPDVPVCPEVDMVRSCENRFVESKNNKTTREILARKEGFFTTSKLTTEIARTEGYCVCLGVFVYSHLKHKSMTYNKIKHKR